MSRSLTFWYSEYLWSGKRVLDDENHDPAIKTLILNIDSKSHNIVLSDLDDDHVLIKEDKVETIKQQLEAVLAENTFNPADQEQPKDKKE
ncbi:transcription factor TFIIH complex subunit Tfb5-domain-containing protein [Dipodascopsis uninucleata]